MRSIKLTENLCCPNGCETFEADRWTFVNVTQNPELKDAVLGGELNLFCCPQCQTFFHGDTDLIYLDEEARLLIFVFSEKNRDQQAQLVHKMQHDYLLLKDTLLKQINLDFGPMCVFGLEELKGVVQKEEERMDESQVIAAAAASLGMRVARLEPAWAREHNFPLYVAVGADETAKSFAGSARKVLKSGLKSPLLKHFAEQVGEGALAPKVCYDTEKT
ncbi:MAG: hypothetical protein IKN49_06135 [Elusimicrobiaceae bacterium]|nr:hypothetical protein [Elusimicrobiaceae bacterium]